MKKIKYNKLIRDKIPAIIRRDNAIPKISILSQKRFLRELKKKLIEESKELGRVNGKKDLINESADVLEILMAVAKSEKISWKAIESKRVTKLRERGGFKKKLFLKEIYQ